MLADALARREEFSKFRRGWRWHARVAEGIIDGHRVVLVKPQTYMNRSGRALGPLLKDPKFDPTCDLLVLVDDMALPLGSFRLRARGSSGGHNGLKSIAGRLQTDQYSRLRIGVGPADPEVSGADFLLSEFDENDLMIVHDLIPTLSEAVECWILEGIETAMNRFNRRGTQSE